MANGDQDERAAASEQKSIDDQIRTAARFSRMEDKLITREELEEKCRGCHKIENMKHDASTEAINRFADAFEKYEAEMKLLIKELNTKVESYVSPVIHWVGELKTGALAASVTLCIALIVKILYT